MYTCLNDGETRSPQLLIMGYSNSVMSCDGISFDQVLLFFLHSACDYSFSSRVTLDCIMFY